MKTYGQTWLTIDSATGVITGLSPNLNLSFNVLIRAESSIGRFLKTLNVNIVIGL